MLDNALTPEIVREKVTVNSKEDGGIVTSYNDSDGEITSTVYTPFQGVSLVYKDVHRPDFISNWRYLPDNALVIEYCKEGRLECPVDDDLLYIAPGDIVVFRTDPTVRELRYPTEHYHAAAMVVHLDESSPILEAHLKREGIEPKELIEEYLPNGQFYSVLKNTEALNCVFNNLYSVPEKIKNAYFGLKILEIILLLAASSPKVDEKPVRRVSRIQVELVKKVHSYVMEHPEERYSIAELAQEFSISPSRLKEYFNIVYGTPIQTYIREQKMKAAAVMLETTDMMVCDVAKKFGYTNFSKFTSAFESVMGKKPKQYSRENAMFTNTTMID